MVEHMNDDRTVVLAALRQAGLSPDADEIDTMVAAYPAARRLVADLYAAPAAQDEVMAISFDPSVGAR